MKKIYTTQLHVTNNNRDNVTRDNRNALHHLITTSSHYLILFFFFSLLLFSLLPSTLFAQKKGAPSKNSESRRVCFGLYFGPTVDWFAPINDALTRETAKTGFLGGMNVDVSVTKDRVIYISTGLLIRYLQGGVAFTTEYPITLLGNSFLLETPTVRTYQTFYLTIPTGLKFKAKLANSCNCLGKVGLYHNIKVGGKQFDNFTLEEEVPKYFLTTEKIKNKDASLFAEAGYIGIGIEYLLCNNTGIFAHVDYGCQFNYFNSNAINPLNNDKFKTIVHSLQMTVGFSF
jgi:hypothetical protein